MFLQGNHLLRKKKTGAAKFIWDAVDLTSANVFIAEEEVEK